MWYERRFDDLERALDEVQAYVQQQATAPAASGTTTEPLHRLGVAIREWIANLIRHACFADRPPEMHIRIWQQSGTIFCVVEDNSQGFDLQSQLKQQQQIRNQAQTLPDGGIGLLMLDASVKQVEYVSLNEDQNRLYLSVRARRPTTSNSANILPASPCPMTLLPEGKASTS